MPLTILIPVYNDNACLQKLLGQLSPAVQDIPGVQLVLVNDGSREPWPDWSQYAMPVTSLHLHRNMGHQKAIAIGLAYIRDRDPNTHVLIMDADGEDTVEDIPLLYKVCLSAPDTVVFAERKKRHNPAGFRLGYFLYTLSFRWLTGYRIRFGNFCCMPPMALQQLVHYAELWNHMAGTVMKSGLAYTSIPLNRGPRFMGQSKMNTGSLIVHGLGAMSVFMDRIVTRIARFSAGLFILSGLMLLGILFIKFATRLAIPGWASTLGSSVLIIMLISVLLSLLAIFSYLSGQASIRMIPANYYKEFIRDTEKNQYAS